MATFKQGLLNSVNGKVGDTVSYTTRIGYSVVRGVGLRKVPFSQRELGNQRTTALVTNFLSSVMPVIRIGFQNSPAGKHWTAYNHASSVLKLTAIKGSYPDSEIDYEKVTFSVGGIPPPLKVKTTLQDNLLTFSWEADLKTEGTDKNDRVMIMVYLPENLKSFYLINGAKRTEEQENIELPELKEGTILQTYISFMGENGKTLSNSTYAGQIVVNNLR